MKVLPLPEIGQSAYFLITTANRIIMGNNITEYVLDRLVEVELRKSGKMLSLSGSARIGTM